MPSVQSSKIKEMLIPVATYLITSALAYRLSKNNTKVTLVRPIESVLYFLIILHN